MSSCFEKSGLAGILWYWVGGFDTEEVYEKLEEGVSQEGAWAGQDIALDESACLPDVLWYEHVRASSYASGGAYTHSNMEYPCSYPNAFTFAMSTRFAPSRCGQEYAHFGFGGSGNIDPNAEVVGGDSEL